MFKWFDKIRKINSYEIDSDCNISIKVKTSLASITLKIPESAIISLTNDNIIYKDCVDCYNFEKQINYYNDNDCLNHYPCYNLSIENKENFIKFKETQVKTFEYCLSEYSFDVDAWKLIRVNTVEKEVIFEKTPLEVFKEEFNSKYKLIETEEEFNDYMSSTLDCDTWCRKKLYSKMKELGLGDGFINSFADLVGNDLEKYHAMIDLASEVLDKDTLMYLYTYKFGK